MGARWVFVEDSYLPLGLFSCGTRRSLAHVHGKLASLGRVGGPASLLGVEFCC